jgi:hypothetical protein
VGLLNIQEHPKTKIISLTFGNFVTPKAGAKDELLFDKPASAKKS